MGLFREGEFKTGSFMDKEKTEFLTMAPFLKRSVAEGTFEHGWLVEGKTSDPYRTPEAKWRDRTLQQGKDVSYRPFGKVEIAEGTFDHNE